MQSRTCEQINLSCRMERVSACSDEHKLLDTSERKKNNDNQISSRRLRSLAATAAEHLKSSAFQGRVQPN